MVSGPMPEDRTMVGGVPGSFNTTDQAPDMDTSIEGHQSTMDTQSRRRQRQAYIRQQQEEESTEGIEQHSPTQIHVPAWKTVVLGGSGGIRVRYYRD